MLAWKRMSNTMDQVSSKVPYNNNQIFPEQGAGIPFILLVPVVLDY